MGVSRGVGLAWLTQVIQILPIEGAKRGFDRGAEAGYAVPNTLPRSAVQTPDFRKIFGERIADGLPGCNSQYNSRAMFGREVVEKFRAHLFVTTLHSS